MKCRFVRIKRDNIPQLGDNKSITKLSNLCALKMKNQKKQIEVYQALFDKGLENSIITNICPVAVGKNWNECPFFKKIK